MKELSRFVLLLAFLLSLFSLTLAASAEGESLSEVGDVYEDGIVNIKDSIFLLQYLSNMQEISAENLYKANTFVGDNPADGKPRINIKDSICLLQYLAGIDVALGEGEWTFSAVPTEETGGQAMRNVAWGIESVTLPPLNANDYVISITDPTCVSDGKTSYIFDFGSDSLVYDVAIPPVGHTVVTDEAIAPQCTVAGKTEGSHCSVCKAVLTAQTSVAALGHEYDSTTYHCVRCDVAEFLEVRDYHTLMTYFVAQDNGSGVTLICHSTEPLDIHLYAVSLDAHKQYVFQFGSEVSKVKLTGDGRLFENVRIQTDERENLNLVLHDVNLFHRDTLINSKARVLDLRISGSGCSLETAKGSTGSTGASYGAFQIGNGGDGGRGGSANIPVIVKGNLNIYCCTRTWIVGGDGGNGGQGGSSDSSGSSGGTGGNGGDGAYAIDSSMVCVYFGEGYDRYSITITGGAGGSGGKGGKGSVLFGFGGSNAPDGNPGSSALPATVSIQYP